MSEVRWRLKEFLAERNLTAYALSKEGGIHRLSTVYRITGSDAPTRVDLPTLAKVLDGLRKMTGEDVQIGDILEYLPDGK